MNILETDLIKLRALEPEDIGLLYQWENDTELWTVSNTLAPFSKYVLRRFIEEQSNDVFETRQLRLVIEDKSSGVIVGAIDLFDIDPVHSRAGVGIMIYGEENRGRGYAAAALEVVVKYAFEVLLLKQLYCNILSDNAASMKLFEGKGFEVIGLKRNWIKSASGWQDEYMLQKINSGEE